MKLWIRSQERDLLEECNRLAVQSIITPNKKHQTWGVISNFGCVGEYATRERCLEIIDEIQELLKLGNPENAFYNITNCEMPPEKLAELFKQVRQDKAIVTKDVEFEVFIPSVVTYEMPEQ